MASPKVTIIDTGCAKLSSVRYALERLDLNPIISNDKEVINSSDKLILPGVGTAVAAMKSLKERELIDVIQNLNKPLLGICLGMQMLSCSSEESMSDDIKEIPCLGIVKGKVKPLKAEGLPLPHMGWNQVYSKDCPLFKDIKEGTYFYFVHSYALEVTEHTVATSTYGEEFTAVVNNGNFFGAQFHPEKSGAAGAQFLKNFINL